MTLLIRGNPRLESADNPVPAHTVAGSVTISAAFVVAFVLGVGIPALGSWALFLLFLSGPAEVLLRRRAARRG